MRRSLLFLAMLLLSTSCVTTHYYTGRTLPAGKKAIVAGLDNLVLVSRDEGKMVKKRLFFSPSLGIAVGLPWQLEAGAKHSFPYNTEFFVRRQLNPRSFTAFDCSLNLHSGFLVFNDFKDVSKPWVKYGLTFSKELTPVQPYFSFYLTRNYMVEKAFNQFYDYQVFTTGAAVRFKDGWIIPEVNYLRFEQEDAGIFSFGIGLRLNLK